ncbi:hypothetical protein SAMN05428953_13536 [Mesorhizobium muleiense]|uniref:Uncharacterized protein n=1 Tax=Mesorhizobium muleiense TaxID=1004279 RepID=A0A1G9JQ62_9HYPH|nr:hypothetical protein SAMN05428953_13536 [Mesorhizobium muleiense]
MPRLSRSDTSSSTLRGKGGSQVGSAENQRLHYAASSAAGVQQMHRGRRWPIQRHGAPGASDRRFCDHQRLCPGVRHLLDLQEQQEGDSTCLEVPMAKSDRRGDSVKVIRISTGEEADECRTTGRMPLWDGVQHGRPCWHQSASTIKPRRGGDRPSRYAGETTHRSAPIRSEASTAGASPWQAGATRPSACAACRPASSHRM